MYMLSFASPYNSWAWSLAASGGLLWLWDGLRTRSGNHGALLLEQAREGLLSGLDKDDDGVIDDDETAGEAAGEQMDDGFDVWVRAALGVQPKRAEMLAAQMRTLGLSREGMVEAARLPGGFQVLNDLLTASQADLGLRAGDQLKIASAAVREGLEAKAA
jgi:hypothetical protein